MRILITLFVLLVSSRPVLGQAVVDLPADAESLVVRELLAVDRLSRGGRSLIVTDPVEASLVRGAWAIPAAGDTVAAADGRSGTWRSIASDENGMFNDRALAGGYAHVVVRSPQRRIVMLHARGHRHVIVNGERRGGDVYNLGITALPIELVEGDNELLFKGGRGQMRIELREPEAELFWLDQDVTKPDAMWTSGEQPIAMPFANASNRQLLGIECVSDVPAAALPEPMRRSAVPGLGGIAPLGVRKLPVPLWTGVPLEATESVANIEARVGEQRAIAVLTLSVRDPADKHVSTFISDIDGSVQYYAVTPPIGGERPKGLILTLHGASVEARNQANAYAPQPSAIVVAPTNRRPFGFDWEDWGCIDAMEVLDHASASYGHNNPDRTYLTGHSMGGHGTWQIGAHFAPKFAAIGPSAGWRDFWSYGGAGEFDESDPIGQILNTANNASRTLLLEENYNDLGVYILHGDADDNVPVAQARFMRDRLKDHPDLAYHEQPGAGHWWGNQCVDWPPMMEFFEDRSIDKAPANETFTTINPAISSEARLFTIHRQAKAMVPTRVALERDFDAKTITVTTENALAISIRPQVLSGFGTEVTITFDVDGFEYRVPFDGYTTYGDFRLTRESLEKDWTARRERFNPALKGAHRSGPFKHAFNNHMAFVYATGGTDEENAWALAKARYDADTWQYRANGSVDVVPDTAFDPEAPENAGRNVIVYGCADTHRLWDALLADAPVRIGRGRATVGARTVERDDVAGFFVYPRAGTDDALVGVVAGTGAIGRRLADEPRYFISGVGYPDWLLLTPGVLETGLDGVHGAGFFGADWTIDGSQSAWR